MTYPIGDWFTGTPAWHYFRQWAKQGLVQEIHDKLVTKVRLEAGREASPSLGLIDSQSVKTMSVTTLKGYDGNKKLTDGPPLISLDSVEVVRKSTTFAPRT